MSTDYSAFKDGYVEISTDSRRRLEITISEPCGAGKIWKEDDDETINFQSARLTEEQVIEIGVNILGPLFYFTDDQDALVQKIKNEFTKNGYTYRFDK